jgi:ATP-binding cassette subfamily B protein
LRPLVHLWRSLRPYKGAVVGASIALTVAAAVVLALGRFLASLIDEGFRTGDRAMLDRGVLILFGATAVLAAASYGRFLLVSWLGERVVADLRRAAFGHALALSPAFFDEARTGEVVSRITADTTLLQATVGGTASSAVRNALLLLGGLAMLAATSAKLTGLVLLVIPLVVLPIVLFGRFVRRLSRAAQDGVADVAAHAEEALHGIRTVQAFTHEEKERGRFAGLVEASFEAAKRHIHARALLTALVILLAFGAVSTVLWIGGHDVLAGRLTPGELSAFVFYAVVVASSAGSLSEVAGDLQRASGAMERLVELLSTEPAIRAPAAPAPLPSPPQGRVAFEAVTFHYPSRPDRPALERFELSVAAGERVALVGPSGAGKTTVFQLLLRFYDPEAGRIRFDGVDVREVEPGELRARIGLVPQEPVIFAAGAGDNIRFGRPDATDAEVRAAAGAAHASEFIDRLPQGFATPLGERGVKLSGGQRQRIAIARAILRDPALLLLDEATSALDAESERLVQQAILRLMCERTTIVIAHRLATVLGADRIVVMDAGRVDAVGRHEELVRQGGLYARLAALQFAV